MGYRVRMMQGRIMRLELWNPISDEEAKKIMPEMTTLSEQLPMVLVLVDLSAIGSIPSKIAKVFVDEAQKVDDPKPNRVALIGANTAMRMLSTMVIRMLPRYQNSRFFATEDEALAWLLGGDEAQTP